VRTPISTSRHSLVSSTRTLKWIPSAHRYTKSTHERSRSPNARASAFQVSVSLVTVEADGPLVLPRNCLSAGTKSPDDNPCKYSSGNTSSMRGVLRPRRQDRRGKPLPLTGFRIDPLVVHARGHHRHRPGAGEHIARGVRAVAHHQPMPVLVTHLDETGDVIVDLGRNASASIRRAPSRTISSINDDDTGATASAVVSRSAESETTVSTGRTFPTSVAAPVQLGTFIRSPGKVRPFPSRDTDFKHCSNCALIGCDRDDVGEESPQKATFVESARVFIDNILFIEMRNAGRSTASSPYRRQGVQARRTQWRRQ
jgi:hypothetical protein